MRSGCSSSTPRVRLALPYRVVGRGQPRALVGLCASEVDPLATICPIERLCSCCGSCS